MTNAKEQFYAPDRDCLRKFNYSNGAGWKTRKMAKIGGKPQAESFKIKAKKRSSFDKRR